jgi:hypothetical protein
MDCKIEITNDELPKDMNEARINYSALFQNVVCFEQFVKNLKNECVKTNQTLIGSRDDRQPYIYADFFEVINNMVNKELKRFQEEK